MPPAAAPFRILAIGDAETDHQLLARVFVPEHGFHILARGGTRGAMTPLRSRPFDLVVFAQEKGALEFLREMRHGTDLRPVLLLREHGSGPLLEWNLEALSLGGFVFLEKPGAHKSEERFANELRQRSKLLIDASRRRAEKDHQLQQQPGPMPQLPLGVPEVRAIGIAISTGGPSRLIEFFRDLSPGLGVPIFIVQHMPEEFTPGFARSLTRAGRWPVEHAEDAMPIRRDVAYLAKGDYHMRLRRVPTGYQLALDQSPPENACRPAADVLFRSLAQELGPHVLAVVMTGMGEDGMRGCQVLRDKGATILVQDEASSTVWGMPGAVVHAKLQHAIVPGARLPQAVEQVLARARRT
jgi:two-component system chemotaxis response regulator CheB